MKKINFILLTLAMLVLSACGNEDPYNMIDNGSLTRGQLNWL